MSCWAKFSPRFVLVNNAPTKCSATETKSARIRARLVEPMQHPETYDVVIIGGGHAGTEAALASARSGASTLLLTQSVETLGQMSCNPAIGGIGKSHLVKEIDALGGAMGLATDQAGIQFRVLNSRKGPAVRATRAQADRTLYRKAIRRIIESAPRLRVVQETVVDLVIKDSVIAGVVTHAGHTFKAPAVVLTTGTFLGGRLFVGQESQPGGRAGGPASGPLAKKLRALPFRVDRLKTGTPPRVDGTSVDFDRMEVQLGDEPRPTMSFLSTPDDHPRQMCCHITYTNSETHDIIRAGLHRSPMYSGAIEGVGPRYCPSIEDKVVRFAERSAHQIFVEPEGLDTDELYPNGISTSLPFDVQIAALQTVKGFERARITHPGYAVEYDFFDPRDLNHSLETKSIAGLFFAGQINGTTGYEEAAAQGLVAGVNAARKVAGRSPWTPARHDAYIGVLIDDLVTLGTNEPYRMFTSRAEYRLRLRQDNADQRLTPIGRELGIIDENRWRRFEHKRKELRKLTVTLGDTTVSEGSDIAEQIARSTGEKIRKDATLLSMLRRPGITAEVISHTLGPAIPIELLQQVETEAKYDGYIRRQDESIERSKKQARVSLSETMDYATIEGLSNELKQKLSHAKPTNLASASRIPGMTPAAISLLAVHAKRQQRMTSA